MESIVMEPIDEQSEGSMDLHRSVMLGQVIEYLAPKPGDVMVDCTIGLGGHAKAILDQIGSTGRLIGIDQDQRSIEIVRDTLGQYAQQCDFIHSDFRDMDEILVGLNVETVDGILLDLGISSFQLDDPQRGFTFKEEGPLDMRMDQRSQITAFDLINSLSEHELSAIIHDYGQDRWHRRIARNLIFHRAKKPIETTEELAQIVLKAIPRSKKRQKIHPATRTFQAFRIAVNRELESLELILDKCVGHLNKGGRLTVIAFHSLEDRIVKQKFKGWGKEGLVQVLVKKPLRPDETEIKSNPRSRSARLRVIERI